MYLDKRAIATGLTSTQHIIENATSGNYAVTAVINGVETTQSNILDVDVNSSVEALTSKTTSYYDKNSDTVILKEETSAKVFTAGGSIVKSVQNTASLRLKELATGAYVIKIATGKTIKVIK